MKKFFAADNRYANETSIGFANTWRVLVFATKKDRDEYVARATDQATRAILKRDIGKYFAEKPAPFSGEAYRLEYGYFGENDDVVLGQVSVSSDSAMKRIF